MNLKTLKHVSLALLLAIASGQALAKPDRGHGPPRGNPAGRLTEALNLSESQTAEISAIFERAHEQHQNLRDAADEDFCSVRNETEELINEVLNAEQQLQFAEMKATRGERRGGRGKGSRRGGGPGSGHGGPPGCD